MEANNTKTELNKNAKVEEEDEDEEEEEDLYVKRIENSGCSKEHYNLLVHFILNEFHN